MKMRCLHLKIDQQDSDVSRGWWQWWFQPCSRHDCTGTTARTTSLAQRNIIMHTHGHRLERN